MKLVKPGDELQYKAGRRTGVKKIPENFIKHHKITMRDNNGIKQANAAEVNKALQ